MTKLTPEELIAYNSRLMFVDMDPIVRSEMQRVRDLAEEIILLDIEYQSAKTYHNAMMVQSRRRERKEVIRGLRSHIRVVVDNSEFWG